MFKDRIKSLRRIQASKLIANPKNFRKHPDKQTSAVHAVLKEIGFASACLVRDVGKGNFELIDGHLRSDIAGNEKVPCLVLDVSSEEADKILATFDNVTSLAEVDSDSLSELVGSIESNDDDFREYLESLVIDADDIEIVGVDESDLIVDNFSILIECENEKDQIELLNELNERGVICRAWIS